MNHILFQQNPSNTYHTAILIKATALKLKEIKYTYVNPLISLGLAENDIIAFDLEYNDHGKCPVKLIKAYLNNLLKALESIGTENLLVADSAYFKTLTKSRKADIHYGSVLPCAIDGYEHMNVILTVNYGALFYNPTLQAKLDMSLNTLVNHITNSHVALGSTIIHSAHYPETNREIAEALGKLHQYKEITCDIETFSLKYDKAGIATISFAWDQHNGIAFCVDYIDSPICPVNPKNSIYGHQTDNKYVKALLHTFFTSYKGKVIYQGGSFDIKVLIYELFMYDLLDNVGLMKGLDTMYRDIDDTLIITYLATNTTAGNKLGLKESAFEFAGNYAQDDIKDVRLIPKQKLLKYNLTDCLSTWYVKNKNQPIMLEDKQLEIYNNIMLPSLPVITHMELTGMPLDMKEVKKAKTELTNIMNSYKSILATSPAIIEFTKILREHARDTANAKLKVKVHPIEAFSDVIYNPNSPPQTAKLLHEFFDFEIIDLTDTKLPATGAKTIKKHLNKLIYDFKLTEEELK